DSSVPTLEDTAYTLTRADFGFHDSNDNPADAFVAVIFGNASPLEQVATGGTLTFNGSTVVPGQEIPINAIDAGQVKFTPNSNVNGTAAGKVIFHVKDSGSTAGGGQNVDPVANTLSLNVTAVNDKPAGADHIVNSGLNNELLEDGAYTFKEADFGFSDLGDQKPPSTLPTDPNTL